MTDVEFCVEYVKRLCDLHSPLDTNSSIQLRQIVLKQELDKLAGA